MSTRSFSYNTDQLPIQIRYTSNNQLTDTDTLLYDSKKRLTLIRTSRANATISNEYLLKYNNDNSIPSSYTRTLMPSGIVLLSTMTFNTNNQLIQEAVATNPAETLTFVYDAKGNLQSSTSSFTNIIPQSYPKRNGLAFDTNDNLWKSSIPLQLWAYIRLGEHTAFSPNNVTKDTFTNSTNIVNNVLTFTTSERVFNYQYNEQKYPIQQIVISKQDTLRYSFNYQCQ